MLLLNLILLIDVTFSTPTPVGVEKVCDRNVLLAAIIAAIEFFLSPPLSGSFHSRGCWLAEESH